jgi:hypothetical protein
MIIVDLKTISSYNDQLYVVAKLRSAGFSCDAMDDLFMVSKDSNRFSASMVGRSQAMEAAKRPAKLASARPSRSSSGEQNTMMINDRRQKVGKRWEALGKYGKIPQNTSKS